MLEKIRSNENDAFSDVIGHFIGNTATPQAMIPAMFNTQFSTGLMPL
jgi:hypothetical protein